MPRDEAGSTGIHLSVAHSFNRLGLTGRTDGHPIEMHVVHPFRNFARIETGIEGRGSDQFAGIPIFPP